MYIFHHFLFGVMGKSGTIPGTNSIDIAHIGLQVQELARLLLIHPISRLVLVQPFFTSYGTVKAALIHMTKMMAAELAPDVRVNVISPGSIMTEALEAFIDADNREKMRRLTPMQQLGRPEDIALAALYLASPAARWVTGKDLQVDGGTENTNLAT